MGVVSEGEGEDRSGDKDGVEGGMVAIYLSECLHTEKATVSRGVQVAGHNLVSAQCLISEISITCH